MAETPKKELDEGRAAKLREHETLLYRIHYEAARLGLHRRGDGGDRTTDEIATAVAFATGGDIAAMVIVEDVLTRANEALELE